MKGRDKFYLSLLIIIIILFFVATYLKYTKIKQPSKEDALKKGFGYYTADESLGCVNDTLKCSKPGTETIVQYCIPNPVTGRGCIDLDGKESYKIGYASSFNGTDWVREDHLSGIKLASNGWDSKMIAYPEVKNFNNKIVMFYNGNSFGEKGFGFAELKLN